MIMTLAAYKPDTATTTYIHTVCSTNSNWSAWFSVPI